MKDAASLSRHAEIDTSPVSIRISADAVMHAANSRNGLTYKGFGLLSGNATSSLLLDYKSEHPDVYWGLLSAIFAGDHPLMNTVKVEMGNDRNNSTGPNAATMRDPDEYPAVRREPGFQLAADARRYQPDVRVSILRWHAPTWVRTNDDVYKWYKNTILAVYRTYGYMVDSVNPDVNERTADLEWVSDFSNRVRTDQEGFIGTGPGDPHAGFVDDVERRLFAGIKVITSDEEVTGTFGAEMIANPRYLKMIDVASYHYSVEDDAEGNFTRLADEFDKEIWNSEAQAVFSNSADRPNNTMENGLGERTGTQLGGIGSPLEMANTLIKGFVESRRTHTIYQPAIGSCYDNMEYASKELISARDPWSGWLYYDAGCAVLRHFTVFARLGWESRDDSLPPQSKGIWRAIPEASASEVAGNNPVSGARRGEPSYLTLASPSGSDFSTIIVNDSSLSKTYRIVVDAAMEAAEKGLAVWRTSATGVGGQYNENWLKRIGVIRGKQSSQAGFAADQVSYDITVEPWSMVTLTTLESVGIESDASHPAAKGCNKALTPTKEGTRTVLDVDPDNGLLYEDDFNYRNKASVEMFTAAGLVHEDYLASRGGDTGAVPRFTTDSNGAFEVVPDADRGHVLRQQIDGKHAANAWIEGDPRTALGDMRWANYTVSVDVAFEEYAGRAPYALLGAREMGGDKFTNDVCGIDFKIRADGVWLLRRFGNEVRRGHAEDLKRSAEACGQEPFRCGSGVWNTLMLKAELNTYTVYINHVAITSWVDEAEQTAGRINLGSSFDPVRFSNLNVRRVGDSFPYYSRLIDDMHMTSWDDGGEVLRYAGPWTHDNGQGMFTYMRTISRSCGPGASVSHTFEGTGLDLFGPSDGGMMVEAFVDGCRWGQPLSTRPTSASLRCFLQLRGLPKGRHTVTFRTLSTGEFALDAIGVIQ
ncbi:MAG: hypothetical protein ABF545_04220 [Bifidobacterium psychraerophilum]|uniref:hypothetical protein n=1 Tax=Bifidobacterium psychraerophilum TaxID=218140 RepID=UPI0039EA739E